MGCGQAQEKAAEGPWYEGLSHADGGPNTLYIHPVSGNALAVALYATEKGLVKEGGLKIHFVDIMQGEQMADWCGRPGEPGRTGAGRFVKLNPAHTIPTLCTKSGAGLFQTGAVLRHLAAQAGETLSNKDNVAMEWRQADAYPIFSKIYGPALGFFEGDDQAGADECKEKVEPMLKHFLGGNKFIGGDAPSVADYMIVPVFTMFVTSKYWPIADERVKTYVADFQAAVKCWSTVAGLQTMFVASKAPKPAAEPAAEPAAKPAAEPAAEPVAEPAVEP